MALLSLLRQFKEYEAKAIMAALAVAHFRHDSALSESELSPLLSLLRQFAEIIQEETLESNRVSLCNTKGEKVVSIYPRVSGSISDKAAIKREQCQNRF